MKTIRNGKVSRASDSRAVAVQHPELAQHSFSEISHEAQRLSEVTRDLIAGCIGMAHEGLDGFPGLTDVATVTDGADCVPLRDLSYMTCIPVDLVGQYDRDRYTVIFEYGPTGTINISSTSPNMRYYEGSLRLQALDENPGSQDIGRYAKNT